MEYVCVKVLITLASICNWVCTKWHTFTFITYTVCIYGLLISVHNVSHMCMCTCISDLQRVQSDVNIGAISFSFFHVTLKYDMCWHVSTHYLLMVCVHKIGWRIKKQRRSSDPVSHQRSTRTFDGEHLADMPGYSTPPEVHVSTHADSIHTSLDWWNLYH